MIPVQFREYTAIEYPRPPAPDSNFTSKSARYLEKPEPEGGYEVLRDNIEYPQLARQAGIEGTVVLRVHIAADGEVTETAIIEGIPRTGFNEAATAGIEKTRFKPARRFDQPIAYWDSITVNFRISTR
ncbi:MAG TPA: energy transducer TonB [bacterium]|nr:energy transducer TonB [bacterium]